MKPGIFYYCTLSILFFFTCIFAERELLVTTVLDKKAYNPGDTVIVALQCRIPDKYHLYGNPLGPGIGKPLKIKVSENKGIEWIRAKKTPASKFHPAIGGWVWAYKHEATFFVIGTVTADSAESVVDTLIMESLICENSCLPVTKEIPLVIPLTQEKVRSRSFSKHRSLRKIFKITQEMDIDWQQETDAGLKLDGSLINLSLGDNDKEKIIPEWDYKSQEKKFEYNILLAIILAFIAGIILNVMPCVLPVLGVKILSFSQGVGSDRRIAVIRSLVFSAGMILIFLVLASFAAFAGLSWGEQFQNPKMLVVIICIIFIFALGMFDIFIINVPTGITALKQKSIQEKAFLDDFIKGMFTTILATPCSGPLLGATLAWTLLQPPAIIYIVFASIGAGMAFPYVLFSSSSRLMKLIPKPGKWMEDFKYLMGFLLIGFAVYLMIGLPKGMIIPTVGLCAALALAVLIYTRFSPFGASVKRKLLSGVVAVLVAALGWHVNFNILHSFLSEDTALLAEEESGIWKEFTPEKLLGAHAIGQHAIIDFTANWCMNCQFNKVTVYHSKEVDELIKQKKIIALKADLTQENEVAESLMHHLGSRSVPFLAIFPGDDPYNPVIMRDVVTKKSVLKVLKDLTDL
ncbi:protein-disulfide reductase DsbD family protein [Fibrobacterota bacterium]